MLTVFKKAGSSVQGVISKYIYVYTVHSLGLSLTVFPVALILARQYVSSENLHQQRKKKLCTVRGKLSFWSENDSSKEELRALRRKRHILLFFAEINNKNKVYSNRPVKYFLKSSYELAKRLSRSNQRELLNSAK